jgi:hypothetical protein
VPDKPKYVFVCGLHRSGTTLLTRNIAGMRGCAAFTNTGVIEDEGQFLQEVYPTDDQLGGLGRFGFNPRSHLTEKSSLLTQANINKLHASWHSHWDQDKSIFIEKTPGNLIMTRFLQRAFPNAYFVVIKRHPIAVSMASQKWERWKNSLHRLFEHWLWCHEIFDQDKQHLARVYELRYEDYIRNPSKHHNEIAAFIGTETLNRSSGELTTSYNQRYFDRWSSLLRNSRFKAYYRHIARKYEPRFAKHNYSLLKVGGREDNPFTFEAAPPPAGLGGLYCLAAQANAWLRRSSARLIEYVVRQLDVRRRGQRFSLPRPVKVKIEHIRGSWRSRSIF